MHGNEMCRRKVARIIVDVGDGLKKNTGRLRRPDIHGISYYLHY